MTSTWGSQVMKTDTSFLLRISQRDRLLNTIAVRFGTLRLRLKVE